MVSQCSFVNLDCACWSGRGEIRLESRVQGRTAVDCSWGHSCLMPAQSVYTLPLFCRWNVISVSSIVLRTFSCKANICYSTGKQNRCSCGQIPLCCLYHTFV
ncbi:unnamed protein product, partial [Discosporangium mesarthrocarpum]